MGCDPSSCLVGVIKPGAEHCLMDLLSWLVLMYVSILMIGPAWAAEDIWKEPCAHAKRWKPTTEELKDALARQPTWDKEVKAFISQGGGSAKLPTFRPANLCNADLSFKDFKALGLEAFGQEFKGVNLWYANLEGADLNKTSLEGAALIGAKLSGADLRAANLKGANLSQANLSNADLRIAELDGAYLHNADLSDARIALANLTNATYAPASAPPNPDLVGIKGLWTVTFPHGQEIGLVQLRDLLQKVGLRDLEREATFAIENGRTQFALRDWKEKPSEAVDGLFRMTAFGLTTEHGRYPGRALKIIAIIWASLIPLYFIVIRFTPKQRSDFCTLSFLSSWRIRRECKPSSAGIYQVWPNDRIETNQEISSLSGSAIVNRLQAGTLAAVGYATYFSLLSAFHIGWRDLNIGTWIVRMQTQEYTLRGLGWVRAVSGIQSLLSVYLLAIWALTYFARPFQ
jgi:hypothetical protein